MFYASLDKQTRHRWLLCFALMFFLHIAFAASMTMLAEKESSGGALDNAVQIDMVASAPSKRNKLAAKSSLATQQAEVSAEESAQQVIKNDNDSVPSVTTTAEKPQSFADNGALNSSRADQNSADAIADPREESVEADGQEDDDQYADTISEAAAATSLMVSAKASWHQQVRFHLEEQKRFPRRALARQQEGVAIIHVIVDRQGNVLNSALLKGSGYETLDRAAADLFATASPLPAPPAEVPNSALGMDIPIEYSLH